MTSEERIMNEPPRSEAADFRIAYGAGDQQFCDLRLPQGNGPHPVVIVLHGGFWRARRSLEYIGPVCEVLTRDGFATCSVEYERIGHPRGGWPGTCDDVAAAAIRLESIADQHHLDLDRVVALGHSAGGHLALWIAAQRRGPRLRGVVSLAGVADLRRGWELRLGDGVVEQFMGGPPDDIPDAYRLASPIERLPLGVPSRIIHGTDDAIVPLEIGTRFAERAMALGDDCSLVVLPGAGHFEVVDPWSKEWPVVSSTVAALLGR